MKVLFLTAILFSSHTYAQDSEAQFTCGVSHKHSQVAFYMNVPERREIELGEWKVIAEMKQVDGHLEASLARVVEIMDATYVKKESRIFPPNARDMSVRLIHNFGRSSDIFEMTCYRKE